MANARKAVLRDYQALHRTAKELWDKKAKKVPAACLLHDNGVTWRRYHESIFQTINPDPDGIQLPYPMGPPAPPPPPRQLFEPTAARQAIIADNDLDPIRSHQELWAHMTKFQLY